MSDVAEEERVKAERKAAAIAKYDAMRAERKATGKESAAVEEQQADVDFKSAAIAKYDALGEAEKKSLAAGEREMQKAMDRRQRWEKRKSSLKDQESRQKEEAVQQLESQRRSDKKKTEMLVPIEQREEELEHDARVRATYGNERDVPLYDVDDM